MVPPAFSWLRLVCTITDLNISNINSLCIALLVSTGTKSFTVSFTVLLQSNVLQFNGPGHEPPPVPTYTLTGCYTDWLLTLVTTISCHMGQSSGALTCPKQVLSLPLFITRSRYIYSPSLNDKDNKNDKGPEKSPMRVNGRGISNPCHCGHSCHGRRGQGNNVHHCTDLMI